MGMWLDLTTSHRQTWLFSSTSTYHSTDLLTARGVAHLVVHGTTGSTSYETIPPVRLETCGGVLSTVDMVVQRRDGPRRLRDHDDDDLVFANSVESRNEMRANFQKWLGPWSWGLKVCWLVLSLGPLFEV